MAEIKAQNKDDLKQVQNPMETLEEALTLCKFGKFQILLMTVTVISFIASAMVMSTSSYVLPIAECDLSMNIVQKGVLNAMPFVGQIGTSLIAGFVADAFGRKICLVSGFIGIFVCSLLQGSSQVYWMLILGKLLDGIFSGLCINPTLVMVSEFTHVKARDRAMMVTVSLLSLALIVTALYSWIMLPQSWNYVFWGGSFELHSWNIYLYVSSIWSLIAAIGYYYLPESPKYLLSQGRENETLDVLKTIYKMNTGCPKETFPIKYLNIDGVENSTDINISMKTQLVNGFKGLKPLLRGKLIKNLILLSFMTFITLLSYSTLRLWLPQLTTIIANYELSHNETQEFCVMINEYTSSLVSSVPSDDNITASEICIPQISGKETYINGIIFGLVSFLSVIISSYFVAIVNIKVMMFTILLLGAGGSSFLYWTSSSLQMALLLSITGSFMVTTGGLQQLILVRVFPTNLRTLALSLMMTIGRVGSLLGNILFPVLLQSGCMKPFLTITVLNLGISLLVYFLPNPQKENSSTGDK